MAVGKCSSAPAMSSGSTRMSTRAVAIGAIAAARARSRRVSGGSGAAVTTCESHPSAAAARAHRSACGSVVRCCSIRSSHASARSCTGISASSRCASAPRSRAPPPKLPRARVRAPPPASCGASISACASRSACARRATAAFSACGRGVFSAASRSVAMPARSVSIAASSPAPALRRLGVIVLLDLGPARVDHVQHRLIEKPVQQPDQNREIDGLQRQCPAVEMHVQPAYGLANSSSSATTRQ